MKFACRLFAKFVLSILLIHLIPNIFFNQYNVSVFAIFEKSREFMSGKVIRVGVIHVSTQPTHRPIIAQFPLLNLSENS